MKENKSTNIYVLMAVTAVAIGILLLPPVKKWIVNILAPVIDKIRPFAEKYPEAFMYIAFFTLITLGIISIIVDGHLENKREKEKESKQE